MFLALVGNKPEFVSLLLENGVTLRDFLQDEETLCELYKQLPSCFFLRKLAKRVHSARRCGRRAFGVRSRAHAGRGETISLTYVSDEVRHLLGKFTQPLYPASTRTYQFNMSMDDASLSVRPTVMSLYHHILFCRVLRKLINLCAETYDIRNPGLVDINDAIN